MRVAILTAGLWLAAAPAMAAGPRLGLELNRLEPLDDGCRAYLVVEPGAQSYAALTLDLVLFDADGLILDRIAVELAPLSAGRVHVRAFPIAGLGCEALGRALVNEVLACATPEGPQQACRERIDTRSRGPVALVN